MKFRTYVPVVTALQPSGELDLPRQKQLFSFAAPAGIDGLLVLGSTGEFDGLDLRTKYRLVDFAAQELAGRVPFWVGTWCPEPADTLALSNYALHSGAQAVLVMTPHYAPLGDLPLKRYYSRMARGIQGPFLLYNFPDCTGFSIAPEVVAALAAAHENLIGMKDTTLDFAHTRQVIAAARAVRPDFAVYTGSDALALETVRCGGAGSVGALANLCPQQMVRWFSLIRADRLDEAQALQPQIQKLTEIYGITKPYVAALKAAMYALGLLGSPACAFPNGELTGEEQRRVDAYCRFVRQLERGPAL
jgi:dihydrodipicolinate synthase/N-acetylneuraminate lyase